MAGDEKEEGGGLWVAISLAIVHGAVCGAPRCCNGRSNFKNFHSHACKTPPPPVPMPYPLSPV